MTPGRERGLTALLCAAGAGLALLAAGRAWVTVRAGASITPVAQDLSGRDLNGAAGALGMAGLAGLAALFATAGRLRAVIGVLIAVFGAGIVYASAEAVQRSNVLAAVARKSTLLSLDAHPAMDVGLWWMVSVTGGVILAVAGLVTAVRGSRWPGMSSRYDRAAAAPASGPGRPGVRRPAVPLGKAPREKATMGRTDGGAPHEGDESLPYEDDPAAMWKSLDRGEDPTARRGGRR